MTRPANPGVVALTRFGYGPRGDGDVVAATGDPRGFVIAELTQPGIASLSGADLPSSKDAISSLFDEQLRRRAARDSEGSGTATRPTGAAGPALPATTALSTEGGGDKMPKPAQAVFRHEALARFCRAVEARVGFAERLVAFWSNHFCISAAKGGVTRIAAGAFEREAIRPHVLGRFGEMLLAVESHPAMLFYLDNVHSIGPSSPAGQRSGHGLNENFGREILELHTLGVGAGYEQADVTGLARILTGWTMAGRQGRLGEPGTFAFNANAHEPGPASLLGTSYAREGRVQGTDALLALARHPATADHVAGKIARAFVADEPPPALVTRLSRRFRDTDGDLRELALTLVAAPESWDPAVRRMRDPYEFVIGSHRALQHLPDAPDGILASLRDMGMPLWHPPGPNGHPTNAAAWASPEAMKLRLDFAASTGQRLRDPPDPIALLDALSGGATPPETRQAVARAESRAQGLALLLMSPAMQRS